MGFVDIPALVPKPRARHRLTGAGPVTDCYYEDFKIGDRFVSGGNDHDRGRHHRVRAAMGSAAVPYRRRVRQQVEPSVA